MNIKQSISFSGKYHFLQNQKNLPCAYCGKAILNDAQIKEIQKSIEGKKGKEIAEILEPYTGIIEGKGKKFLAEMIYFSKQPQFRDWKFKQLSMLGSEEKIYNADAKKTVENMLHSIKLSVEHTTPRANDGINTHSNYLPMHVYCNDGRSDENYADIAVRNPEFVNNIRKSLAEIKHRVLADDAGLTHYNIHLNDGYFEGIKENLEKQGLGKELFVDI